jgi:RNase H-fold protein (predicted Holliday junction resolvase)
VNLYLAVDPGKDKCGLAVLQQDGEPLLLKTVERGDARAELTVLAAAHPFAAVLLGDGTGAGALLLLLKEVFANRDIVLADEKNTTREAYDLYWRLNPPRGWKKYLPRGVLTPAAPVDAYAALSIARRWLAQEARGPRPG